MPSKVRSASTVPPNGGSPRYIVSSVAAASGVPGATVWRSHRRAGAVRSSTIVGSKSAVRARPAACRRHSGSTVRAPQATRVLPGSAAVTTGAPRAHPAPKRRAVRR